MSILLGCIYVYQLCACYTGKSEEDIEFARSESKYACKV